MCVRGLVVVPLLSVTLSRMPLQLYDLPFDMLEMIGEFYDDQELRRRTALLHTTSPICTVHIHNQQAHATLPCTCPWHSAHPYSADTHSFARHTPSVDVAHTLRRRSLKLPHDQREACMQNARQQHFDWEPRATAHKSSWTLTSTVVCEPGETAHKSSSTRTHTVVCEPGQTAHKSSSTRTSAVVCEPGQTAHESSSRRTNAVVWEPGQTAHKSSCVTCTTATPSTSS